MSNPFQQLRSISKSPQQIDSTMKYQTQPSRSPKIQFIIENKPTTPFIPVEMPLRESNKLRLPVRQSFAAPDVKPLDQSLNEKRNLRSISGSWQQCDDKPLQTQLKSAEPLLLKENETLRNLVSNLQQQLKTIRQKEQQSSQQKGDHIQEVDEDKEHSARIEEIDRLRKQIQNERDKFHAVIQDLEKKIFERDEQLSICRSQQVSQQASQQASQQVSQQTSSKRDEQLKEEIRKLLDENDKLNEIIEKQMSHQESLEKQIQELQEKCEKSERFEISTQKSSSSYIRELERKSEDLVIQNNSIMQLYTDSQVEVAHLKEVLQKETQGKSQSYQLLQQQNSKLISELSHAQTTISELEAKVRQLGLRAESAQTQLEMANEKCRQMQDQVQKARIRTLESGQLKDRHKREITQLTELNENLKRSNECLKREKEKIEYENEQLLLFNQKRKDEFDLLFNDLEEAQNELMMVTKQHHDTQIEKETLEARLKHLEAELLSYK